MIPTVVLEVLQVVLGYYCGCASSPLKGVLLAAVLVVLVILHYPCWFVVAVVVVIIIISSSSIKLTYQTYVFAFNIGAWGSFKLKMCSFFLFSPFFKFYFDLYFFWKCFFYIFLHYSKSYYIFSFSIQFGHKILKRERSLCDHVCQLEESMGLHKDILDHLYKLSCMFAIWVNELIQWKDDFIKLINWPMESWVLLVYLVCKSNREVLKLKLNWGCILFL